jgi:hypothetical protein
MIEYRDISVNHATSPLAAIAHGKLSSLKCFKFKPLSEQKNRSAATPPRPTRH